MLLLGRKLGLVAVTRYRTALRRERLTGIPLRRVARTRLGGPALCLRREPIAVVAESGLAAIREGLARVAHCRRILAWLAQGWRQLTQLARARLARARLARTKLPGGRVGLARVGLARVGLADVCLTWVTLT